MKYGFADKDWDAAKVEMAEILAGRAKLRGMIPYSDLVGQMVAFVFPWVTPLGPITLPGMSTKPGDLHLNLTVVVLRRPRDLNSDVGFMPLRKRSRPSMESRASFTSTVSPK